jgi:hypothetical protein
LKTDLSPRAALRLDLAAGLLGRPAQPHGQTLAQIEKMDNAEKDRFRSCVDWVEEYELSKLHQS